MRTLLALALAASLGWTIAATAQTAATVTATCKDGSSFSGTSKRGACSGHGGVQAYTSPSATTAPAATPVAPAAAPAATAPATKGAAVAAPGAHAGQVWVNTASKVYHCPGSHWFGKTKQGTYMTEAAAKADGDRASNGKACFP